jgi:hypothetical protein
MEEKRREGTQRAPFRAQLLEGVPPLRLLGYRQFHDRNTTYFEEKT